MEARMSVMRWRGRACLVLVLGAGVAQAAPATPAPAAPAPAPVAPAAVPDVKDQCIDANEAAQRLNRAGSLLEARKNLDVCVREACPALVRQDCVDLLKNVDAATPTVIFDVRDGAGSVITAVNVTMDHGRLLADHVDDSPIAVDPGWHRFKFEAIGLPTASKTALFKAGEKGGRMRVELADHTGSTLRTAGLTAGALGIVALAVGSYFGMEAKSTYNGAHEHCPQGNTSCDAVGVQQGALAHDQASDATIAFVVGGLLIGGGATLYVLGTKMTVTPASSARGDGAGLLLRGTW